MNNEEPLPRPVSHVASIAATSALISIKRVKKRASQYGSNRVLDSSTRTMRKIKHRKRKSR